MIRAPLQEKKSTPEGAQVGLKTGRSIQSTVLATSGIRGVYALHVPKMREFG